MPNLRLLAAGKNEFINGDETENYSKDLHERQPQCDFRVTRRLCERLGTRDVSEGSSRQFPSSLLRQTYQAKGQKLQSFPSEIFSFVNLRVLDLSKNNLASIPSEIHILQLLRRLSLRMNKITCKGIPAEIVLCSKLESLDLAYNELDSIGYLAKIKSVRHIDLSFNRIEAFPEYIHTSTLESVLLVGNPKLSQFVVDMGKRGFK